MVKHTGRETGALRIILTGLLVTTISFFSFMLLTAALLFFGDDPTYRSELWSFGAMILSGAVGGFVNSKLRTNGGVTVATLSSLALILILFTVGVITGGLPSVPSLVNYAIYVAVSAISAFFASARPKKRRHK